MSMPKNPSSGPQHPTSTKPLKRPTRLQRINCCGPAQAWLNLMGVEVVEQLRADPESQDGKVRQSLIGMLGTAIRRPIRAINAERTGQTRSSATLTNRDGIGKRS